jgi:hypothetical protein
MQKSMKKFTEPQNQGRSVKMTFETLAQKAFQLPRV